MSRTFDSEVVNPTPSFSRPMERFLAAWGVEVLEREFFSIGRPG
jgi:hypothetical protein